MFTGTSGHCDKNLESTDLFITLFISRNYSLMEWSLFSEKKMFSGKKEEAQMLFVSVMVEMLKKNLNSTIKFCVEKEWLLSVNQKVHCKPE